MHQSGCIDYFPIHPLTSSMPAASFCPGYPLAINQINPLGHPADQKLF